MIPGLHDDLVRLRRRLHADPELGLALPRTQALLLEELAPLDLEITTGRGLGSITAVLRGGRPGPVVLLRADMDALPVVEATGLPFAATNGAMHACGHDLHMAGLIGAARLLAARRDELAGTVVLMLQPGEEGFAGGRLMIEEGVLDAAGERPVAAFAMHVDCSTDSGLFVTRSGPMMASASGMRITVTGTGGHAAFPHLAVDPIPAAAALVQALQTFVARRMPATDPAVVSVVSIVSDSTAPNVLAARVELMLNIRTLSRTTFALVRSSLAELAAGVAAAHGCGVETEFIDSYPVTHNDPEETERVIASLTARHGADRVLRLPAPSMASEDFAYVLDEVPGTLLFLGTLPPGVPAEGAPSMHSESAVFDDALLGLHAETLAQLALDRLAVAAGASVAAGALA
ncbi:M20 family metallopeptidase [Rathayibacter festucae]|uniref:M20 metallopeptidase family protein n=1 Tax=Rathayibacter festucae TaxID=110937 RepID=UPI002A698E4E|nr:M20 family metallopeptidase [Rathayibacter festucae]MDY0914141.1 M20 family metallopeptidase [Rathayibacter festucae]